MESGWVMFVTRYHGAYGAVSGDEPASRGAGDERGEGELVLLDTEHDSRGLAAVAALDAAIQRLAVAPGADAEVKASGVQLTGVYHNLLRQWAEM